MVFDRKWPWDFRDKSTPTINDEDCVNATKTRGGVLH